MKYGPGSAGGRHEGWRPARVNVRLIAVLLVGMVLLGVGAVTLRKWRHQVLAERALAEARRLESRGDFDTAAKRYQDYLERNPADVEILEAYARANLQARPREAKHVRKAVQAYQELLRIRQGHEPYLDAVVRLHARGQAPADQLAYWATQWVTAHPESVRARLWLGRSLTEGGKLDEARKTLDELMASADATPDAYILAGLLESRSQAAASSGLAVAAQRFDAGVSRFPDSAKMAAYRGRYRLRMARDVEGAREDLERAEKLAKPDEPLIHMRLFDEWSDLGDLARAETHLQIARATDPAIRQAALEAEIVVDVGEEPESWEIFLFKAEAKLMVRKVSQKLMTPQEVGAAASAAEARFSTYEGREWDYLPSLVELYAVAERGNEALACAERLRNLIDPASPIVETQRAVWARAEGLAALAMNRPDGPYRVVTLPERVDMDPRILLMKALAYRRLNLPARAAVYLERYLRIVPGDGDALLLLAQVQLDMGDWGRAKSTAERLQNAPRFAEEARRIRLRALIGELRPEQVRSQPALVERLREELAAIRAVGEPEAPLALLESVLEEKAGHPQRAEAVLRSNLDKDDPSGTVLRGLAVFLERQDRLAEAIEIARDAAERVQNDAQRWMLVAELCWRGKRPEESRAALDRAVSVAADPQLLHEARLASARLRLETGQYREGVQELQTLRAADPLDLASRTLLLDVALSRREGALTPDPDDIQALIQELKSIESEEEGVRWRIYQARVWLQGSGGTEVGGSSAEAETLLSRALTLDPSRVDACLMLADLYRARGDAVREEETCRRVLMAYPGAIPVADRLLSLLNAQLRFKEAMQFIDDLEQKGVSMTVARIDTAMRSARPTEALAALDKLRAEEPGNFLALLLTARVRFLAGARYAEVEEILNEAEKAAGHTPLITYLRATMLEAEGRLDEAERVLTREVETYPGYSAYVMRGPFYFRHRRLEESERDFRKLAELPDNPVEGALLLGRFYDETGRRENALATFEQALISFPDQLKLEQARLELLLGSASPELRSKGEARLKELLAAHPENPLLRLMNAAVLLRRTDVGSRQQAERILTELAGSPSQMLQTHLLLIQIYRERGDLARATAQLRQARVPFPRSVELDLIEADMERVAGNRVRARQLAEDVLKREPGNAMAAMFLVDMDIQAGRLNDGVFETLQQMIAANPDNEDVHVKLAVARQSAGRLDEAITGLSSFVESRGASASPKLLALQADLLRLMGRFDEARAVLDRAEAAAANIADLRNVRMRWLVSTGQYGGLVALLREEMGRADADRALCVAGAQMLAVTGAPENLAAARSVFEFVTRAWPEELEGWLGLATAAYLQGEMGIARQAYEKVIASDRGRPDQQMRALNGAAWILYAEGGDLNRALNLVDRAISVGGGLLDPEVLDTRACILEKTGNLTRARADFERCYRMAEERSSQAPAVFRPQWAKALVNLARVTLALGDKETARAYLLQAQALHRESPVLDAETLAELERLLTGAGG